LNGVAYNFISLNKLGKVLLGGKVEVREVRPLRGPDGVGAIGAVGVSRWGSAPVKVSQSHLLAGSRLDGLRDALLSEQSRQVTAKS
jgi:hypothetical protein